MDTENAEPATVNEKGHVTMNDEGNDWFQALPLPWSVDPTVLAFLVPSTALSQEMGTVDGRVTVELIVEEDGTKRALRILEDVGGYLQQIVILRRMGLTPITPEYLGPLSEIPQEVFLHDDTCPLILIHDAPHAAVLNLKRYLHREEPVFAGFHSSRNRKGVCGS
jgi:hypothetical protein